MWQPTPHADKSQLYLILISSCGKKHLFKFKGDGKVRGLDDGSFRQGEDCQGVRMQLPVGGSERAGGLFVGKETQEAQFHEATGMSTR